MKLNIYLLLFPSVFLCAGFYVGMNIASPLQSKCNCNSPNTGADVPPPLRNTSAPTFEDLLDAIEWVESKGDPNAVGDGGDSVGCMQIQKICVADCNRILGQTYFNDHDRWSRVQSRHMAITYLHYYADGKTFEDAARIWNGGPKGHLKESTKPYWEKVKARMELNTKKVSE